jgi:hypothetical protein
MMFNKTLTNLSEFVNYIKKCHRFSTVKQIEKKELEKIIKK